ncbi:MAG: SdiA-regulated domain-containing protein [Ferruginibacter sp.]
MTFYRQLSSAVIIAGLFMSCNAVKKKLQNNDSSRYDLLNPYIIKLPDGLAEISGMAYYSKDTSVFAIKDEDGILYKVSLEQKGVIRQWQFGKKHDFEDVVLLDSTFYVLISNGEIETLQFGGGDTIRTGKLKFQKANKAKNEFESMYYDDSLQQLVLICKNCEGDAKKKVTAMGYNIVTQVFTPMVYEIDVEPIAKKIGMNKMNFRPSAAAINPATNELYILASINHLIVVTDRQGRFKDLYELDRGIYNQPEGLAFTPWGDMIISNEANEAGLADILIVKNKKKGL